MPSNTNEQLAALQQAKAQAELQKQLAQLEHNIATLQQETVVLRQPPNTVEAADKATLAALDQAKAIAERQKALMELEGQTAQAQRDAFVSRLPTATVTPLAGEMTLAENTGYVAELVAYQAIRRAAQKAADDIRKRLNGSTPTPQILIVATLDLVNATTTIDLILAQVSHWQAALTAQLAINHSLLMLPPPQPQAALPDVQGAAEETAYSPPAAFSVLPAIGVAASLAGGVFTAAGSLAGSAASVATFFRNNYTLTGRDLSFKQEVAQSLLAHALPEFDMTIAGFQPVATSALLLDLQRCISYRIDLAKSVALLGARADAKLTGADAGEADETKNSLKGAMEASNTLLIGWDEFILALTTVGANSTSIPLARALTAEQLRSPHITHYLYINVASSGAEVHTEQSLWRSGRVTYQGGGILNYILIERSGRVVAADAQVVMSDLTTKFGNQPTGLVDSFG